MQRPQYPEMVTENNFLIPKWPSALQQVDVVKARFVLDFISPCVVKPTDFLGLGRVLRVVGRQFVDSFDFVAVQQWKTLFQPALSDDPVARRKFQKPAPAFIVTMPIMQQEVFDTGDRLELEVLFIGTGIPLIRDFLRSLIHVGHLGLVVGDGLFEVTEVYSKASDHSESLAWRQSEPLESLTCIVQSLDWLLQNECITNNVVVKYITPTRLMVNGKPLRKPRFAQVFPFMLRRVTSMLYAHCGIEVLDDPAYLLELVNDLHEVESRLHWHDWRSLAGRQGLVVGGFMGEMKLEGQALEEVYWLLAVASLFGIGKAATSGAGRIALCP